MIAQIVIDAPGSSGALIIEMSPEQFNFLTSFATRWNDQNGFHSQPFITLQELPNGNPKNNTY